MEAQFPFGLSEIYGPHHFIQGEISLVIYIPTANRKQNCNNCFIDLFDDIGFQIRSWAPPIDMKSGNVWICHI